MHVPLRYTPDGIRAARTLRTDLVRYVAQLEEAITALADADVALALATLKSSDLTAEVVITSRCSVEYLRTVEHLYE